MTLKEIAAKINAYLKEFEANKAINKAPRGGISPYYFAGASQSGRYVYVTYVSFQGSSHLNREEAEKYLAFLEQGGKGRHYRAI